MIRAFYGFNKLLESTADNTNITQKIKLKRKLDFYVLSVLKTDIINSVHNSKQSIFKKGQHKQSKKQTITHNQVPLKNINNQYLHCALNDNKIKALTSDIIENSCNEKSSDGIWWIEVCPSQPS